MCIYAYVCVCVSGSGSGSGSGSVCVCLCVCVYEYIYSYITDMTCWVRGQASMTLSVGTVGTNENCAMQCVILALANAVRVCI